MLTLPIISIVLFKIFFLFYQNYITTILLYMKIILRIIVTYVIYLNVFENLPC